MNENQSFLGRGWSFPPTFNKHSRTVEMVEEEEDISQSLHLLLSTIPGERMMKPEYGCDLQSMVFSQIDAHAEQEIIDLISDAILMYEPRITLEYVTIDSSQLLDGILYLDIVYTIRKINIRTNIVYPFYLTEGTNITTM